MNEFVQNEIKCGISRHKSGLDDTLTMNESQKNAQNLTAEVPTDGNITLLIENSE